MAVKGLKVNSLNMSDDVSGLVLISSTTIGSAVSSVSVNDVFSSTYTNYRIIMKPNAFSTADVVYMRLRVSGADDTTSNYRYTGNDWFTAWNAWSNSTYGNTFFTVHRYARANGMHLVMDILNPFATNYTTFLSNSAQVGTDPGVNTVGGSFIATTSFTGFTLYPAGGNMTGGTIKVYGYQE